MGGPNNTPSSQSYFSLSCSEQYPLIPQIDCAAELLRDGAGPVKHDGLIRITPQAWPQFPVPIWFSALVQEKR
jgi:hypothetical protein